MDNKGPRGTKGAEGPSPRHTKGTRGQNLFQKKRVATFFKTRLSLKEKAKGLLMHPRCKNAAEGLREHIFLFSFIFL